MKRLLLLALLAGCNNLLGIEDFHLADAGVGPDAEPDAPVAPPDTVVGGSHLTYIGDTAETVVAEDLSTHTIQAYIPDDAEPSGFRVVDGVGRADGTFTIENVPDGATYYLKVVRPDSGGPAFFVTDLHAVDFDRAVGGRVDSQPVTQTQTINANLTGMQSWAPNDFLVAGSYNTSTEEWSIEQFVAPLPGATSVVGSWDWGLGGYSYRLDGRPALVDMTKGDRLQVAHVRNEQAYDTANARVQLRWSMIDIFDASTVTMQSGVPLSLTGAFTPITANKTVRFIVNKALYDTGYEPQSGFSDAGLALYGSPGATRGIRVGLPLAGVSFSDFSRASLSSSSVDVAYGDPVPMAWPRIVDIRYTRLRWYKIPGTTTGRPQVVGFFRALDASETPPSTPDVAPPTAIMVDGGGGKRERAPQLRRDVAGDGVLVRGVDREPVPRLRHQALQRHQPDSLADRRVADHPRDGRRTGSRSATTATAPTRATAAASTARRTRAAATACASRCSRSATPPVSRRPATRTAPR